ncbi:MAG: cytochrome c oxidase subunit 3 family protein [Ignavibacteria bacterium]|nr:cytochrome c oxidase subunit 3 family protein [Ignavibacteria bacterium]
MTEPDTLNIVNQEHTHRDDIGSKMGMWLFLFTELLLFGGLFILYASYRFMYKEEFIYAATKLDLLTGTVNTIILLTSSLTIVLAILSLQKNYKKLCLLFLFLTVALGFSFLINKYFEWRAKIEHGLFPGGSELLNTSKGETIFFGLYYSMTGLHALHVIAGLIFILIMTSLVYKNLQYNTNYQKLENSGLYWHLVDIIWIFLFPLFYLIH